MDDWKKLDETSLPRNEDFYCSLNMDILVVETSGIQKEFGKNLKLESRGG